MLVTLLTVVTLFTVKADNEKPIRFENLPDNSKEFIQKYFSEKDISFIKVETEILSKSYEVYFVNGSKVEFDRKGEWETIDCINKRIPDGIVPGKIAEHIAKNHFQSSIVKIERDRRDYEIELDNDLEIKFDLKFNVIKYDD